MNKKFSGGPGTVGGSFGQSAGFGQSTTPSFGAQPSSFGQSNVAAPSTGLFGSTPTTGFGAQPTSTFGQPATTQSTGNCI